MELAVTSYHTSRPMLLIGLDMLLYKYECARTLPSPCYNGLVKDDLTGQV